MQWKLFADLAEVAGEREVSVTVERGDTVGDALDALLESQPGLESRVRGESGGVADHVNVLRNGTDVSNEKGLDTAIEEDDELALFPPVTGG